ncbi:MAG: hypothetical protein ABI688_01840 [Bacteroidota bacterium]
MHKFLFFALPLLVSFNLSAQEKKRFTINPGETVMQAIPRQDIFRYPGFKLADVSFKDGRGGQATLNYNSVYGEMQFLDANGDTVSIADENSIRWIAVGVDTFYFQEGWLEQLAHNMNSKLAKKKLIQLSNRDKNAGMGVSGFATETNTKSTASQQTRDIIAKETLTYTEYDSYYFGDHFNKFFPANKKNLLNIYRKQQGKVEQYLQDNKIDFTVEADLEKLFVYLQGL